MRSSALAYPSFIACRRRAPSGALRVKLRSQGGGSRRRIHCAGEAMNMSSGNSNRILTGALMALVMAAAGNWSGIQAQAPAPAKGVKYAQVSPDDLKEWLTYLA